MKAVGIVCEYNPIHNGHKRQLDILRENRAEVIICAMSGNFSEALSHGSDFVRIGTGIFGPRHYPTKTDAPEEKF